MHIYNRTGLYLLMLILVGCANYGDVRKYANESKKVLAYKELNSVWVATDNRESRYLFGKDLKNSQKEGLQRDEIGKEILKIHTTVVQYFIIMEQLTGDYSTPVDSSFKGMTEELKNSRSYGFNVSHVNALAKISEILVNWAQKHKQHKALKEYVTSSDPHLQLVLKGMKNILRVYKGTLRNEKGRFRTLLVVKKDTAQDRIVAALINMEAERRDAVYASYNNKIVSMEKLLDKIAKGHSAIVKSYNKVNSDEARKQLDAIVKDLIKVRLIMETA